MNFDNRTKEWIKGFLNAAEARRDILTIELRQIEGDIQSGQEALAERTSTKEIRLEQMRDAARELSRFTAKDLREATNVSYGTAKNYIDKMIAAEMIEIIGYSTVGKGRSILYRYIKPTESGPGNPSVPLESYPKTGMSGKRATRSAVIGPARPRSSNKDLDTMLRSVASQGARLERTASGHIRVITSSGSIIVPSTPSDSRGIKNARADMRRIGINL